MSAPVVIRDLGDERVLRVGEAEYRTHYSARVLRLLVERKGPHRAALYLPFRETRGRHFLTRLFAYLEGRGARDLRVLEIGCSFGHITEFLDAHPLVAVVDTFDVDAPFVEITRVKVEELALGKVRQVLLLTDDGTTRLPFADGAFDLVVALGVVEHLPARARHRHVDEYYRVLARWPIYLERATADLGRIAGGPRYRAAGATLATLAEVAGKAFPETVAVEAGGKLGREEAALLLGFFHERLLPDLLLDATFLRCLLEGERRARANSFSLTAG